MIYIRRTLDSITVSESQYSTTYFQHVKDNFWSPWGTDAVVLEFFEYGSSYPAKVGVRTNAAFTNVM